MALRAVGTLPVMASQSLEDLALRLGVRLRASGWMLATAESCTGGWISTVLTAIPGSSLWFERGFVTYSNASKQELLRVSAQTLESEGAVSETVAREMAQGALQASRAQVSVAVTGIAGPDGGTPAKPVGTVCFAWAVRGGSTESTTMHFDGNREAVRRQSVDAALQGVLRNLDDRA